MFEWTKYAIFGRKSKTLYSMKGCTDTVIAFLLGWQKWTLHSAFFVDVGAGDNDLLHADQCYNDKH